MQQNGTVVLAGIAIGLLFIGCSKSEETITGPPATTNLIINSSFESNGDSSLHSWDIQFPDAVQLVRDAAPNGGSWSVAIRDEPILPVANIRFTTAAPSGTHVYAFSFWAKYSADAGSAWLRLKRSDTTYTLNSVGITDTVWTSYHMLDTLTTNAGDSLRVTLGGGFAGRFSARTFFDLCKLEVLN